MVGNPPVSLRAKQSRESLRSSAPRVLVELDRSPWSVGQRMAGRPNPFLLPTTADIARAHFPAIRRMRAVPVITPSISKRMACNDRDECRLPLGSLPRAFPPLPCLLEKQTCREPSATQIPSNDLFDYKRAATSLTGREGLCVDL